MPNSSFCLGVCLCFVFGRLVEVRGGLLLDVQVLSLHGDIPIGLVVSVVVGIVIILDSSRLSRKVCEDLAYWLVVIDALGLIVIIVHRLVPIVCLVINTGKGGGRKRVGARGVGWRGWSE
jgi:hypothetical protein